MSRVIRRKYFILVFLVSLILLHSIVNFDVLGKAKILKIHDEASYLQKGLDFHLTLFINPTGLTFLSQLDYVWRLQKSTLGRPPFLFILQAFVWKLIERFGIWDENLVILVINTLFLLILVFSCYGIGRLLHSRKVGLAAAIITLFSPIVYEYSRRMLTDLPLTAMVTFSIFILLKTRKFQSLGFSILLGVVAGVSQLIREPFFMLTAAPFLYYLYQSVREEKEFYPLLNFIICLEIFLILVVPVYLDSVSLRYILEGYHGLASLAYPHSDKLYYLSNFNSLLGNFIFIITIPLFIIAMINIRKTNKILLLWFIVPFVFYSNISNQFLRFIMPLIPAYALIVSYELFTSNTKKIFQNIYLLFILLTAVIQYSCIHCFTRMSTLIVPLNFQFGLRNKDAYNKFFKISDEVVSLIAISRCSGEDKVLDLTGISEIGNPLGYKLLVNKLYFSVLTPLEHDSVDSDKPGVVNWEQVLLSSNYLIAKEGGIVGRKGSLEDIKGKLLEALAKNSDKFRIVAEKSISEDNSKLIIYKKI